MQLRRKMGDVTYILLRNNHFYSSQFILDLNIFRQILESENGDIKYMVNGGMGSAVCWKDKRDINLPHQQAKSLQPGQYVKEGNASKSVYNKNYNNNICFVDITRISD
jgi:hypothetical protein